MLSIILPAFNEQEMVPIAYREISSEMKKQNIPYEIIFVDDGSKDGTYREICQLTEAGQGDVFGISFSRNFGKEAAIFAGLKEAKGDCVVVMDCDLQHPVAVISQMYELWKQGYEVVEGVKASRGKESAIHKCFAKLFYSVISMFSDIDMRDTSDFKLLDRKAVDSLLDMPERAPFFRGLSQWIGFRSVKLPFYVEERKFGSSKWSTKSLIRYAVHNITIFSSKPLQMVTWMGVIFLLFGFGTALEALIRYFSKTAEAGFTTVICLICISSGTIMISLGIIGNYIAQIYEEIKARPRYIVSKRCGGDRE